MTLVDLVSAALADPFRVALLVGLVVTQRRTAGITGRVLPLAAGVLFVAVILPTTMQQGLTTPALLRAIGVGLVANVIWLAAILVAFAVWDRTRR
jgi:hypothetical protein